MHDGVGREGDVALLARVTPFHRRFMRLALASLMACAGCYAYMPTSGSVPATGADLQLTLTDSGTVVLSRSVGPSVGLLTGRFVGDSADTYLLNVTRTERRDGNGMEWRGERVGVPHALVSTVAVRKFSPGRTLLFGGLGTGALVAIAEAFAGGGGATVPGGTPTGPPTGK
jgi:hypothetical protein